MAEPHVVILGAGPAGVGAAWRLRNSGRARVTVIEQRDTVGGNAGSFDFADQRVDHGSHRLHPTCDPLILADIRGMLGDDLLVRPRHGRIRLRGRWIRFPLNAKDLVLRLDPLFAMGATRDMALRAVGIKPNAADNFAAVLHAQLGSTICRSFYFPYARKIWGVEPSEIAAEQAQRRVSANSFAKLMNKIFGASSAKPVFYYPRRGYGQISEAYADAASNLGATIMTGWGVGRIDHGESGWTVTSQHGDVARTIRADHVWSTLPINVLAKITHPPPPDNVRDAAASLQLRAMLLIYLALPVDRFTEFDAHYFPGEDVRMTRLSEPKHYADAREPVGRTVICAELPCSTTDDVWPLADEQLGELVADDLARSGLNLPAQPDAVCVKRLPHAYPIYLRDYERHFKTLDAWAADQPNLLTFGRQGLFAHDNTHHALAMAYAAVECFSDNGVFDRDAWQRYRKQFESHVVED